MGIGVSSGEAIAGEFGHPVRSEFTALGRIINLGSRLCSAARGGQVIISETTYQMLGGLATANRVETLALKGISNPGPAYELTDIKKATTV
jgi:adenylate cyclase